MRLLFTPVSITPLIDTEDALLVAHRVNSNNMRKKQDIMWEQSTLWESVEKWVTKYLNSYY